MADLSDVENTLVTTLANMLFGATTNYQNGAVTVSLLGPQIRLYRGWVNRDTLDPDLAAGQGSSNASAYIVNVSVFSDGQARLTSRYEWVWKPGPIVTPTFTATVAGQTVTFGGSGSTSQIAGIQLNNYPASTYRLISNDTPATVATAFAALLNYASPTVNGATITFPSNITKITAKTAADSTATMEIRRQEQIFRISVWAPNPALRDLVASNIDNAMAQIRTLQFPDGSCSNVPFCRGTFVDDVPQKAHEWRRDFRYAIEYPTIQTATQTPILFPQVGFQPTDTSVCENDDVLISEDGNYVFSTTLGNVGGLIEGQSGPDCS